MPISQTQPVIIPEISPVNIPEVYRLTHFFGVEPSHSSSIDEFNYKMLPRIALVASFIFPEGGDEAIQSKLNETISGLDSFPVFPIAEPYTPSTKSYQTARLSPHEKIAGLRATLEGTVENNGGVICDRRYSLGPSDLIIPKTYREDLLGGYLNRVWLLRSTGVDLVTVASVYELKT